MLPPWTAIGEIVVIYAALLTADWLHPGLELSDIRPHPFWFPVLLLSLQYGTVSGLLSAMIAIALLALGGFREQTPSETYFTYLLTISPGTVYSTTGAALRILLTDRARRAKRFSLPGMSYDDTAALSELRAVLAMYGGDLPVVGVIQPALIGSDRGFVDPLYTYTSVIA